MQRALILLFIIMIISCNTDKVENVARKIPWETRQAAEIEYQDLYQGKSYLPIYSHIYNLQEKNPYYLTATVSIRNISTEDRVYLLRAEYYDTDGELVENYLDNSIFINPLETIDFVISESNTKGGSGANFIFKWAVENEENPPLFKAVMISTRGQQGLSFTTRGVQIY